MRSAIRALRKLTESVSESNRAAISVAGEHVMQFEQGCERESEQPCGSRPLARTRP